MEHASHMLRDHVGHLEAATQKTAETLDRVEKEFEESARVLSESSQRLDALQVEVHNVYTTLVERHERSEQTFRERAEDLIGKMDLLQDGFNANAREIIEHLQGASADYAESTAQFREAGVRFGEMSREIGQRAYDAIAERAEVFQGAIVRHEQASQVMERQLRDLMDRLDPRLLPREEWEAVVAALRESAGLARALVERLDDSRPPTTDHRPPTDAQPAPTVVGGRGASAPIVGGRERSEPRAWYDRDAEPVEAEESP
jgi:hypothetical protein